MDFQRRGGKSKSRNYRPKQIQNHMPTLMKGFLITCDQNQERRAVSEAYRFLNDYIDQLYEKDIERIASEPAPKKKVKKANNSEAKTAEGDAPQQEGEAPKQEGDAPQQEGDAIEEEGDQEEDEGEDEEEETKNEENAGAQESAPKLSASAELEKELQKNKNQHKVLYSFETDCKGVVFIRVNPIFEDLIDVKKVANIVMKDIWDVGKRLARICFKMVPIERSTRADLKRYEKEMKEMLAKKFSDDKPVTWYLQYRCKNNEQFKQQPFLDVILENIGKVHSVNYKNPDYTIFVEMNKHLLCLSILKKFNRFKKYSLKPENVGQPPKKLNKGDEAKPAEAKKNQTEAESLVAPLEFEEKPQETNGQDKTEEKQGQQAADEDSDVELV